MEGCNVPWRTPLSPAVDGDRSPVARARDSEESPSSAAALRSREHTGQRTEAREAVSELAHGHVRSSAGQ